MLSRVGEVFSHLRLTRRVEQRGGGVQAHHPIVLSYSQHHFEPGRITGNEQTSAGRLAQNIYQVLSRHGSVLYADRPGSVTCDLLFTIDNWERCSNVKAARLVVFPAVSHWRYTTETLMQYASLLPGATPVERMHDRDSVAAFERWIARADLVVLIGNQYVADTYSEYGVPAEKLLIINCGVDTDYFLPLPSKTACVPVRFVFPATNLSLSKGTPILLRAWEVVSSLNAEAELWLIGRTNSDVPGIVTSSLPRLKVFGWLPPGADLYRELLQEAHFVVFPTLSEGQAGTLLESMSCGCVPIATMASGIDADEYGGYTVEMGNAERLAEVMLRCIDEAPLIPQRTALVRRKIEQRHSWDEFRSSINAVCLESSRR